MVVGGKNFDPSVGRQEGKGTEKRNPSVPSPAPSLPITPFLIPPHYWLSLSLSPVSCSVQ